MAVRVCDAIMGTGKSMAAITYMNEHSDEKFIYITPYLDEADRIKKGCGDLKFVEPSNKIPKYHFKKTEHTAALVKEGRNITTTHQAFKRYSKETLEDIREQGYTLIIDENVDVLEQFSFSQGDLKLAVEAGYIKEDDGKYALARDDYDGVLFNEMFGLLQTRTLSRIEGCGEDGDTLFFWTLPPELITSFKDVFVLTYLFDCQSLKYFFDIHKIPYRHIGVSHSNGEYRFSDVDRYVPEYVKDIDKMINVVDGSRLNSVGDNYYSLSMSWFNSIEDNVSQLKRNVHNCISNIWKDIPFTKKLWGTYSGQYNKIKGKGYSNSFLTFNSKATNAYKDKTHLIYAANPFMNVGEKLFYLSNGITVNEDMYALSIMVQWIWRSAIRDGKPISIYIPSRRMRDMLIGWIDGLKSDSERGVNEISDKV